MFSTVISQITYLDKTCSENIVEGAKQMVDKNQGCHWAIKDDW